jgi:hypothetical protein
MGPPASGDTPPDGTDPSTSGDREDDRRSTDGEEAMAAEGEDDGPGEASDSRGSEPADRDADSGAVPRPVDRETNSETTTESVDREGRAGRSVLVECIEDPTEAAQRLPYVLSQLEAGDRATRLTAATVCCLVAVETEDEELVEYLIRRMSDRLTDEQVSIELTTALDYLSSSFAEQVEPLLAEMADENREVPLPQTGNFTRNYYYGQEMNREGVGRMRIAGEATPENPRRIVTDSERDERERIAHERRRRQQETETDERDSNGTTEAGETGDEEASTADPVASREAVPELSAIALRSRFDELHVTGERHRGRYATTYESLVGESGTRQAVALRLFHQPDPTEAISEFNRELAVQLRRWQSVSDHDRVVTVLDWGVDSRPWIASSLIEDALADRGRPTPAIAFEHALALADTVCHLHQHGVVHAGLDSRTVVYPGERFEDEVDRGPLVNNVGLISVFRHYFEPADCLDPRYAAPEYYDTRFGRIDHATDVYQLGAVCYRLFTGRPPFTGEFEDVRESILNRTPPAPSGVVDGLPGAIDDLLAKAMAKQKLRRYETVEQLRGELASIADEHE